MICIARTFGAPVTVPAGKQARSTSNGVTPSRSSPVTSETRWDTCENRSTSMKRVDPHRTPAADAREVVAAEVDEHDVLGAILLRRQEALDVPLVRRRRPGDRTDARVPVLACDEALGRRADERDAVQLEQEEVRRRIDPAQSPVEREGRRRGGPLRALRRDDLVRVTRPDVLLARPHHLLVALLRRRPRSSSPRSPARSVGSTSGAARRSAISSGSPASTSATPAPWSKRTSVSTTTNALSGSPAPSVGSGTVGSSVAAQSYETYPTTGRPSVSASSSPTIRAPRPTNELRPRRPRSTDSRRKLPPPAPRRRRYAPSGVRRSAGIASSAVIRDEKGLSRGLGRSGYPEVSGSRGQRNNAREHVERGGDLVRRDGERRCEPDDVLAGAEDEQSLVARGRHDVGSGRGRLDAEEEPAAAHTLDTGQRIEPRDELCTSRAARSRGARRRSPRPPRMPRLPTRGSRRTSSRGRRERRRRPRRPRRAAPRWAARWRDPSRA